MDARQLLPRYGLCAVGGQGDLVREKISDEVHHSGEYQCNDHALFPGKDASEEHQQQRQRRQQKCGLECVSHGAPVFHWMLGTPGGCFGRLWLSAPASHVRRNGHLISGMLLGRKSLMESERSEIAPKKVDPPP